MKHEVHDPSRSLIAFTFLLIGDLNFDFCRSRLSMVQAQMLRHTTCMTFCKLYSAKWYVQLAVNGKNCLDMFVFDLLSV